MQRNPGFDRGGNVGVAFAWPGKTDALTADAHRLQSRQFTARCNVEPIDLPGHERQQRRERIGLYRVMQFHADRHRQPQRRHTCRNQPRIIDKQRRPARTHDQITRAHATDCQLAIDHGKARRHWSHRFAGGVHGAGLSTKADNSR